jgi:hypothetical protein
MDDTAPQAAQAGLDATGGDVGVDIVSSEGEVRRAEPYELVAHREGDGTTTFYVVAPTTTGTAFRIRLHHRGAQAWRAHVSINGTVTGGSHSLYPRSAGKKYRSIDCFTSWNLGTERRAFTFQGSATVETSAHEAAEWTEAHGSQSGAIEVQLVPSRLRVVKRTHTRQRTQYSGPAAAAIPEKLAFKQGRSVSVGIGSIVNTSTSRTVQHVREGDTELKSINCAPTTKVRILVRDRRFLERQGIVAPAAAAAAAEPIRTAATRQTVGARASAPVKREVGGVGGSKNDAPAAKRQRATMPPLPESIDLCDSD